MEPARPQGRAGGLRDVHVGVDRGAQGRRGLPRRAGESGDGIDPRTGGRPRGRRAAVRVVRLRRFRTGCGRGPGLGRAAGRGHGGRASGRRAAGRTDGPDGRGRGQRGSVAARCGRSGVGAGAVAGPGGRGTADRRPGTGVGRRPDAGQHVWADRSDGHGHHGPGGCRHHGRATGGQAGGEHRSVCAGPAVAAGAAGGGGGALCGRGPAGPRLPRSVRADGGAVRGLPVRRAG